MTKTLLYCLCFLLSSCWSFYGPPVDRPAKKVLGYVPLYSNDSSLLRIYSDTARDVKLAGKIYTIGNFILQNEMGKGIHVLDKSDPAHLVNAGFVHIPGNSDFSIKNNFLYANSFGDMVVVDISDYRNVREISRVRNAFRKGMEMGYGFSIPPPEHGVYYECVNSFKGIHTGWQKDSVYNHSCYYP